MPLTDLLPRMTDLFLQDGYKPVDAWVCILVSRNQPLLSRTYTGLIGCERDILAGRDPAVLSRTSSDRERIQRKVSWSSEEVLREESQKVEQPERRGHA